MGTHVISVLKGHPHIKSVLGYDSDPSARQRTNATSGISVTAHLEDILREESVKVVFVTASNDAHKTLALAAMRAGKAVLLEKPIAPTLADSEAVVAEAERLGAWLQIGFELRYSLLYTTVKDWIDAGLLGPVLATHCTYVCSEFHGKGSWRNQPETGGGMFGEKLCHYVDLPRGWIDSPVEEVYCASAPNTVPYYKVRDNYQATCRFRNGAISHLSFFMHVAETFGGDPLQDIVSQQADDGHELRFLVTGKRGAAETDVFRRRIRRWEFGDSPKCLTSKIVESRTWQPEEDHRHVHDVTTQTIDVVDRVIQGLPPKIPASDSLETMRLVDAAERSADTNGIVRM